MQSSEKIRSVLTKPILFPHMLITYPNSIPYISQKDCHCTNTSERHTPKEKKVEIPDNPKLIHTLPTLIRKKWGKHAIK